MRTWDTESNKGENSQMNVAMVSLYKEGSPKNNYRGNKPSPVLYPWPLLILCSSGGKLVTFPFLDFL